MKYMGSKRLLAKELVPVIECMLALGNCRDYVEPFVGGCNMIDKIKADGVRRHGYDNNKYLIAMLSCLDAVEKEMPDEMPREEYEAVRADYNAGGKDYTDWYIGAVGFLASHSGRFFDGGYSGEMTVSGGKVRNYYLEAKRNVLAQAPLLRDVELGYGDYRKTCSEYEGAVIYCDPPYKGVKAYNTSRGFDHAAFWDWCRAMARKNIVLVSEQTAPDEPWIETVWQQQVTRTVDHGEHGKAVEKLFLVRGEFYDKCMRRKRADEDLQADLRTAEELCIKCGDPANDGKSARELLAETGRTTYPAAAHPNTAADYGMPEVSMTRNRPVPLVPTPPEFSVNAAVERTNWDINREKILERCAQGMCFDCLARRTCERLCRERSIDVTLTKPPCAEAWRAWAAEPCIDGDKGV